MVLLSKLGLILIVLQILLTVLIPIFARVFPTSCSIICIFSQEQSYFMLFNLPGIYISSIPFIHEFIINLGTEQQRLGGEITLISNVITFLFAVIVYYFIGLIIEIFWRKKLSKVQNRKKAMFILVLSIFLAVVLFFILAETFMRVTSKIGQRIEQFQKCKNKNGVNTDEWKIFRYEFNCKNGQYDGFYKVYKNGVPDIEYTYKNGIMICDKQYSCGKDLK